MDLSFGLLGGPLGLDKAFQSPFGMLGGLFGSKAPAAYNFNPGVAPQLGGSGGLMEKAVPTGLDPQILGQMQAQQAQPQGLFGRVGQWMQAPHGSNGYTGSEIMQTLGAGLSDLYGGGQGGMARAQAGIQQRHDQQKQQAAMGSAMAGGKFDPQAYMAAGGQLGLDDLKTINDLNRRHFQYIEGPDGVYQIDPDTGQSKNVQQYERQAPAGYMWAGDKLAPIPGGPADIGTIKTQAATRRGVTVSMPTPSRARVAGVPKKTAGAAPWAMNWSN
jgi:hypothetical protein